jgi:hypothetical protein
MKPVGVEGERRKRHLPDHLRVANRDLQGDAGPHAVAKEVGGLDVEAAKQRDCVRRHLPVLAILPGTTHLTIVERADWLASMVTVFLDR